MVIEEITLFIHLEIKKAILNYITLQEPALKTVPQKHQVPVCFTKHHLYMNFYPLSPA